jgi:ubiquinone/menaquinone biosynthesis C-methylase UbiE
MDQKSLYERQAGYFTKIRDVADAALIGRDQYVLDFIAREVSSNEAPFEVLELSVGEGRLSASLLRSSASLLLTGADISSKRLGFVSELLRSNSAINVDNFKLIECNFDSDFGDISSSTYRFVIALDILEHVVDVFGFVENCYRVLVPGGCMVIRVPNIAYLKHRLGLLFGKLPVTASWFDSPNELTAWRLQHGWDGGHFHLFTIPILYRLLQDYGFRVELCRDPGTRFEKFRDLWPNLLYSNPLLIARK